MPDIGEINFEELLPSEDDAAALQVNMATLIGRILCKHMPYFASFATGLGRHIHH